MRSVALPGTQRRARDHRRRPRRHQGGQARDRFAERFHDAGYSVLAFDYRHLGESGGAPRQLGARCLAARRLAGRNLLRPELAWRRRREARDLGSSSVSGGHVFTIASRNPQLAAAIAHSPLADGAAATLNALRHTTPLAFARLTARAVADVASTAVGRKARSRSTGRSARRGGVAHHTGCTERGPSAQPWQQVSALTARSHCPLRTARGILSSWPIRIRHPLPPTGCRL